MKKPVSIALLLLFLFHVAGYYLVFWGLRYQVRAEMSSRLEAEDYATNETVTFRIPITVPYYAGSRDYERVTGSFEHGDEFFKLVKQKLERDTLYIVCLKDHNEKKLVNAMTDFVKLSNDLPLSQQTFKLIGSFMKDFVPALQANTHENGGWCLTFIFISRQFDLLTNDLPVFSPPPDQPTAEIRFPG